MKYAIITPTFKPHFKYIDKYLESFNKFVLDKEQIDIIFTISEDENKSFQKILKKYPNINYKVVFFEDLLQKYMIPYSPDELLAKYKKFNFQTLKKFYTMLDSDADYFLVLDSESMWIKDTKMVELFDDFFNSPFITSSAISKYKLIDNFKRSVIDNINYVLNVECYRWFLENFVWFYDRKILNDLFNQYGSPICIVDKIYNLNNLQKLEPGIFEIELYQEFIYLNNKKYNYSLRDVNLILEDSLSVEEMNLYQQRYYTLYHGGCGLLEQAMMFLTNTNYKNLANAFRENNFNIIRCDYTNLDNYGLQKAF